MSRLTIHSCNIGLVGFQEQHCLWDLLSFFLLKTLSWACGKAVERCQNVVTDSLSNMWCVEPSRAERCLCCCNLLFCCQSILFWLIIINHNIPLDTSCIFVLSVPLCDTTLQRTLKMFTHIENQTCMLPLSLVILMCMFIQVTYMLVWIHTNSFTG